MAQELSELVELINNQKTLHVEAIFVHAWGDLHNESIEFISHLKKTTGAKYIVLNGEKEYEREAEGFEYWKKELIKRGLNEQEIIATKKSGNTHQEAEEFAKIATEMKIKRAIVYSVP